MPWRPRSASRSRTRPTTAPNPSGRGGAGSTSAHRSTLPGAGHSLRCAFAAPPGRDGIGPDTLAEVAELVWAAGGRTLGLFASQRAAGRRHCTARELPAMTILCQGDAQLGELTRTFVAEPETSLFGTLSLWQGVDVPGDTCRLVIIDKIPFPRPATRCCRPGSEPSPSAAAMAS